ncbi:protein of unknown function [Magnetospirillum sp. XM-1]|nr:protein of unknown function [Magnetospirillum sp. XM-1]
MALSVNFKCPYHAKVIKTLDIINKPIGAMADEFITRTFICKRLLI